MLLSDGVFNFLDTFEERSLKLKMLDHEAGEEKQRLEKSLEEVIFSDEIYCLDFKGGLTYKVVTRWPVPRWSQGGHKNYCMKLYVHVQFKMLSCSCTFTA